MKLLTLLLVLTVAAMLLQIGTTYLVGLAETPKDSSTLLRTTQPLFVEMTTPQK